MNWKSALAAPALAAAILMTSSALADGVLVPFSPDGVTDTRQCSWFAPVSGGGWYALPFNAPGHKDQWDVVLAAWMNTTQNFQFTPIAYGDGRACDPVASQVYIWGR